MASTTEVPVALSSGILDNHRRGRVGDFLREKICTGSELSFVSAYFTIYAYEALREELNRAGHLRFLFGEPSFVKSLDPDKTAKKAFRMTEEGLELANKLEQKRIARECADWIREKVDVRTVVREGFLHGKLYHVANGGAEDAVLGSSNFTVRGLGLGATGNIIELNLEVDSFRDRADLKRWFDELWDDTTLVRDVKAEVIAYLEKIYENHSPEFIYYLTLFHIFREFLEAERGVDEALRQTTLLETKVWNRLFAFQKDGAKGAINRILAHNGCILADSVGLGKTYEALAVIKYFELRNERVLVLCPKKLMRNWTIFRSPERLNPFDEDRFRYDVFAHTDLSRQSGIVNGAQLADIKWGNYDLVVIDESHNFRNNAVGTPQAGRHPTAHPLRALDRGHHLQRRPHQGPPPFRHSGEQSVGRSPQPDFLYRRRRCGASFYSRPFRPAAKTARSGFRGKARHPERQGNHPPRPAKVHTMGERTSGEAEYP